MKISQNYFDFDYVIIMDENMNYSNEKKRIINKNPEKNFLAVTFNHRMFGLKEKSFIKSEVEHLNLNHLMFSLRPSLSKILKKKFKKNNSFIKNFLQFYFSLIIASTYNIKNIILSSNIKENLKLKDNYKINIVENLKLIKKIFKNKKEKITFFNLIDLSKLDEFNFIFLKRSKNQSNKFIKKIAKTEKNLFWLGFDSSFKDVNWNEVYKKDHWSIKAKNSGYGKPLFKNTKYCNRCCIPETWEGIEFDEYNICKICRLSEEKMNINWSKRGEQLKKILKSFKNSKNNNYDCLLPISGGKDSTFQSYILTKIHNLNPLCITHGQNWMSLTGRYNLENCLQKFDLDHLIFIPSRKIVNNVAKKSVYQIGDACWHCHVGIGSFSIQTSVNWGLKLIVYGEAPADTDARGQHKKLNKVSPYRFLEESAIKDSSDFVDKQFNQKKLSHWSYPPKNKVKSNGTSIIHLGQYIFWDEHKNIDLVTKEFGWRNFKVENTYKGYKSVECVMAGVHDYFNFIKRGIGRATVHASEDVRRGLITREEGFELAKKYDTQKPHALKYYMKITNLNEKTIINAIKKSRKNSKYASKKK